MINYSSNNEYLVYKNNFRSHIYFKRVAFKYDPFGLISMVRYFYYERHLFNNNVHNTGSSKNFLTNSEFNT
jgi:hypothetical protein